jgi:hypothetical protein
MSVDTSFLLQPLVTFLADFFNLVIMQWFNLLSTRTRRLSLFQQNPIGSPKTRNLYLFPAMLIALGIGWYVFRTLLKTPKLMVLTASSPIFHPFNPYSSLAASRLNTSFCLWRK